MTRERSDRWAPRIDRRARGSTRQGWRRVYFTLSGGRKASRGERIPRVAFYVDRVFCALFAGITLLGAPLGPKGEPAPSASSAEGGAALETIGPNDLLEIS